VLRRHCGEKKLARVWRENRGVERKPRASRNGGVKREKCPRARRRSSQETITLSAGGRRWERKKSTQLAAGSPNKRGRSREKRKDDMVGGPPQVTEKQKKR